MAFLSGQVQFVDAQEVPPGHLFELLPGCHVVINSTRWSSADSQGSMAVTLPPRPFSIFMRAGYSYAIRVQPGIFSGMSGTVALIAEETAPDGSVTHRIKSGEPCEDSAVDRP